MRQSLDPESIRSRIDLARSAYRDTVLSGLLSADSGTDQSELQRLQDMDERLRAENIDMELLRQRVAQDLRDAKAEELKKMSDETERELEQLERERERMMLDLDRKQSEVEGLQRDLRRAEQRLAPVAVPAAVPRAGVSAAQKEQQLLGLAQTRAMLDWAAATSLSRSGAAALSSPTDTSRPAGVHKNEVLDKLVAEAESLLRQHQYEHHGVLRRLDRSRMVPTGTAAESVNSLAGPRSVSSRSQRMMGATSSEPTLPVLLAPAGYVSTRDTLDRWLGVPQRDSEESLGRPVDLAEALHLHGQYKPFQASIQGEKIPPSPQDEPLMRTKSASSDLSRGNRRAGSRGESIADFTGAHSEPFRAAEDGVRIYPVRAHERQSHATTESHRYPVNAFPQAQAGPSPIAGFGQNNGAILSHHPDPHLSYGQHGFQQPIYPQQYYGESPQRQWSQIHLGAPQQQFPFSHSMYDVARFQNPPNIESWQHSAEKGFRKEKRRYEIPDRIQDQDGDQSPRTSTWQKSVVESSEVANMKARMKALADELEAENAAMHLKLSKERGEPIWPAIAGAVKNGVFRRSDDHTPLNSPRKPVPSDTASSQIVEAKRRVDDILNKLVPINSFTNQGIGTTQRSRVGGNLEQLKERSRHEAELEKMRLEMDMLRQRAALDELKDELEAQRVQRTSEKKHEDWLREKKYRLQAIRVEKALSTEQKQFEDEMTALGITTTDQYVSPDKKSASGPKIQDIVTELPRIESKEPFEFIVDGLIVPVGRSLDGDFFRVVVGFVAAHDGAMIGRMQSSDWQQSGKALQRGKSFKNTQSELNKLRDENDTESSFAIRVGAAANVVATSGVLASKRATQDEDELMRLNLKLSIDNMVQYVSQLRVVVEVQVRLGDQGVPRGAGWCTIDPSTAQQLEQQNPQWANLGATSAVPRQPRLGRWRAPMMTGVADRSYASVPLFGRSVENMEFSATNSLWLLFRISQAVPVVPNPVNLMLERETTCGATLAIMMGYTNYTFIDEPPLQRSDSLQSVESVQPTNFVKIDTGTSAAPSSPIVPATASSTRAERRPPSTAKVAQSSDSSDVVRNLRTPVPTKLAAGLDVISAINEMKNLSAQNEEVFSQPQGFFEMGTPTGPTNSKYTKNDGIDVYVDGARFLPNNVTVTRCVIKMLSSDLEPIPLSRSSPVVCGFSEIESDAASPIYRTKVECRASVFNCTATLLFRIDTLDAATLQCSGVAYAALRVFCTRDRDYILLPNDPGAYVNTGKFQLPLFAGRVPTGGTFQDTTLAVGMPRIPCASLLVRIVVAPKSSDGLATLSCADVPESDWGSAGVLLPIPDYSAGHYDGRLCEPTSEELLCYSAKLGEKSSQRAGSRSVKGFLQRVLSIHVAHKFPRLPEGPSVTSMEIQQWANSLLPLHDTISTVLDYSFAVPYYAESGVDVNIVSLYNVPDSGLFSSKTMLFKAIYSISPPAVYYSSSQHSEGVQFTIDCDFESSSRAPEYLDGYRNLNPTSINEDTYLIVDVRTVTVERGSDGPSISVESAGAKRSFWTLIPISKDILFGEGNQFVATGIFQVPLIEGPVSKTIIESEKPMRALLTALEVARADSTHLRLSGASVLVMIQNPLLRGVLQSQHPELYPSPVAGPRERFNSTLIAQNLELIYVDKFAYAASLCVGETPVSVDKLKFDPQRYRNVKILNSQLAKIEDHKKLVKSINKLFAESTELKDNSF